jgi:hypothetical protein
MNNQFTNSNFGRILYVAIITLIFAATIFVIWYMTVGYKQGTYATNTRLGSVYIGGFSEDEIEPRLDEKISYWYNDETVTFELSYQGYTYSFDRNSFLFDIEASLYRIVEGEINEIVVYYQGTDRETVENEIQNLDFLQDIIDNVDVSALVNDILYDASLMKSLSSKNVEDYLKIPEDSIDEIKVVDFSIPEGVVIDEFIAKIEEIYPNGEIVVPAKELFDLISVFGDTLDNSEMSILSSAMLAAILETNFIIHEVHYEPTIDFGKYTLENYPFYARNAQVNQVVNESFSFYNPNSSSYYFVIEKEDENGGFLKLRGLPFQYDISITIDRTELQYISQTTSDARLLQVGQMGAIVIVNRLITDLNGNIVYNENILFEFYPPIKEITFEP